MMTPKKLFLRIHLTAIFILLINLFIIALFRVSLISTILIILKILFWISGAILFLYYIKPFKKRAIYFSFYFFYPIFAFIGWLIDGIFGAILSSFLFLLFAPADCRFENDQIQINKKFTGFLGACCKYEVIEKKYFVFEKKSAEFKFEEDLYFKKNDIKTEGNSLQIHLTLKDYDYNENHFIVKDTIMKIPLKK